jgi:hypothetical protein
MFPFTLKAVIIQVEHYLLPGVLAQKPNTICFLHEEGVCEQVLDFLHSTSGCLRIHLST